MLILNHFINELLCNVSYLAQVKRNRTSHLILEEFDEVDARVGADYELIP